MNPSVAVYHDITRAAAGYSQLSGIMAGFSFAVLVWVVDRLNTRDANTREDIIIIRALVFLGITFLGNLVDSFFWALLSGEATPEAHRVSVLAYVSTWLMAQLAPMTMQAMTLVISTAGSRYAVKLFRRIFFVTLGIAGAFVWSHTYSILVIKTQQHGLPALSLPVVALFIGLLGAATLLSRRPPTLRFGLDTETSFSYFVSVSLIGTLLAGTGFALVTISPQEMPLPETIIILSNLAWAVLMAWSCAFLPDK